MRKISKTVLAIGAGLISASSFPTFASENDIARLMELNGLSKAVIEGNSGLTLKYKGYNQLGVNQGYWIDDKDQRQGIERFVTMDFDTNNYINQFTFTISGTSYYQVRYQQDETGGWTINPHSSVMLAEKSNQPKLDDGFFQVEWPWLLLRNIAKGDIEIQYEGTTNRQGQNVGTFKTTAGEAGPVKIYTDPETMSITAIDLLDGDTSWRTYEFHDYVTINGIPLPSRTDRYQNGMLDRRVHLSSASTEVETEAFTALEHTDKISPSDTPQDITAIEIAPGYYSVGGPAYKTLFTDLGGFYAAFDLGPSRENAEGILKAFRQKVGESMPLKYAVLSHHHIDHRGGLTAFQEAGATLVLTEKSKAFLMQIGEWQEHWQNITLPVDGSTNLGTGNRTVRLIDIGNENPHAESLLMAWFEKEKILFQADLMDFPNQGPHGQRFPDVDALMTILDRHGLSPILYANAHMRHGTHHDVEAILKNKP